jgi:molecular chaperone GrpE (heat shock protein)
MMSAEVPTIIAALSAAAAVGSFVAYLYFARRSALGIAREEALALAETRGEVIAELRARLASLEQRHHWTKADCERQVQRLQRALEEAHTEAREAYQTQRFYSATVIDLLEHLLGDLEQAPPNVDGALSRIRELLFGDRPAA